MSVQVVPHDFFKKCGRLAADQKAACFIFHSAYEKTALVFTRTVTVRALEDAENAGNTPYHAIFSSLYQSVQSVYKWINDLVVIKQV